MIELTKLNELKITVNADLIEIVEETPDTIVTLTTGKKIIVRQRSIPRAQKSIANGSFIATHRIALRSAPVILKPI